jgi:type I restriction enzyme S subunit
LKRINTEGLDLEPLSITKDRGVILQSEKYSKRIATDPRKYVFAEDGDFAFDPMSLYYGAIGRVGGIGRGLVSPDYVVFSADQTVDSDFLLALFRYPEMHKLYESLSETGNTFGKRRRLYWSIFEDIELLLPPLSEQKKIAAILSSVDEAIAATQAVIDQLQVVKKAMMAELLTRGLPGRHTRFKQTEIGEVPEEWQVVPFGDLLPAGTFNGLYKAASFYGSGTPMLDMGDLFRTEVVDHRERRRVRLTDRERANFVLQAGDLLFARRSLKLEGSGQCAMVPALPEYPVPESSIIRARLNLERCWPTFFLYFWNGATGHQLRMSIARQVAVSGISAGDLVQLHVPVPSLDEQRVIASAIDTLGARLSGEHQVREQLGNLKTALMSVLLTGEVRVKPDEEAS